MTPAELRAFLTEMHLSQADFARLVDVTARAVTLWMSGERAISGPAAAYIRVFRLLPPNLRQIELSRLKEPGAGMRDGWFAISFKGPHGTGVCILVLDGGRVYGSDKQGVRYDGEYVFDEKNGDCHVRVKVTFPPNVASVVGISKPHEWTLAASTTFDPRITSGPLPVQTSMGPLEAEYLYLRTPPELTS